MNQNHADRAKSKSRSRGQQLYHNHKNKLTESVIYESGGCKRAYGLCFLQRCQRPIGPICMVLALCPQPKALKLHWYTKLFGNLFLRKSLIIRQNKIKVSAQVDLNYNQVKLGYARKHKCSSWNYQPAKTSNCSLHWNKELIERCHMEHCPVDHISLSPSLSLSEGKLSKCKVYRLAIF